MLPDLVYEYCVKLFKNHREISLLHIMAVKSYLTPAYFREMLVHVKNSNSQQFSFRICSLELVFSCQLSALWISSIASVLIEHTNIKTNFLCQLDLLTATCYSNTYGQTA